MFALKCFSGKIKCFKAMLVFLSSMENRGIEEPPSQLNGKFHYFFFFETVPYTQARELKYGTDTH